MTHYTRDAPPRPSAIRIGDTIEMHCLVRGEKGTAFTRSPCCMAGARITAEDLAYANSHRADPMEAKRSIQRKCGDCKAVYWLEFPKDFEHMVWKLKRL